jgi:hypothetical protein
MAADYDPDKYFEAQDIANEERRARCGDDGEFCGLPGYPVCGQSEEEGFCRECGAPANAGKCTAQCQTVL